MIEIMVRNLSYIVTTETDGEKSTVKEFAKRFRTYDKEFKHIGKGKFHVTTKLSYDFNGGNKLKNEFIFNITTVKDFLTHMKINGFGKEDFNISDGRNRRFERLKVNFTKEIEDRKYQKKYISLLTKKSDYRAKLVDLEMGKGKGLISIKSYIKIGYRLGVIVLPKYIEKWKREILEFTDLQEDDIISIQGGKELRELFDRLEEGISIPKVVIFSNRTILNYINEYETTMVDELFTYSVKPHDICSKLGLGTIIIDEVHQEFYSVFKSMLYFDPKYFIALSATLVTKDARLNKLYNVLFPDDSRLSLLAYSRYINIYAISYSIDRMHGMKFETQRGYNHIMFEQSIMRYSVLLDSYIKMIVYYLKAHYIDRRVKGQKAMIFIATIEMCTIVTSRLKSLYPSLDIRRYTGDDPYENVIDADIRITTIKSAGTAIDIKGLITVLQTVSVNSDQANLQAMGRLREIEGTDVDFIYFWCDKIKKQQMYHNEKLKLYANRAKKIFLDIYRGRVFM